MKKTICILILVLILSVTMSACGEKEDSTVTGMVVSVDGTTVSLQQFDFGSQNGDSSKMPSGGMPNGEKPDGEAPNMDDFNPDDFDGEKPEMPDGSARPDFSEGGATPNPENMPEGESTTIDLKDAHISVESDGEKASGSMDDIKAGVFLTITLNSDGKATNVTVSSSSGFGGFGGKGSNGGKKNTDSNDKSSEDKNSGNS